MDGKSAATQSDPGPFGRPLFDSPSARALSRVAVVDVGSNSVRLVVFDGAARSPAYFHNEKIMCGLGAGMAETGLLNPEGRARALAAMRRFKALADGIGVSTLTAVATAAVRDAADGPAFRDEVFSQTGIDLWVIDGEEEARLSAQGVLLGWPGYYGLVCDIGGSSMELAEINGGTVGHRVSSGLGPLKLMDIKGGKPERRKIIQDTVSRLHDQMGEQRNRLFLVGGSWRAIARIDMERRNYPLHVLHEYRMSAGSIRDTLKYISVQDQDQLRNRCGVSAARMALVPYAGEVLSEVIRAFRPRDIAISAYGIREGMLYEQMPQLLKDRDPLVEACRYAEAKDARVPGFGRVLYEFIMPLFPKADEDRQRLIRAACLLHDVSWRAHPDYRAEVCFDTATRANLGGLKHWERVFLGLALLHRYRNKRDGTRFENLFGLLDGKARTEAEVLGKAMRFGAMLWPATVTNPGTLNWVPKKKRLEVRLTETGVNLFGEVVNARFLSLAEAMNARAVALGPDGAPLI